MSTVYLNGRFIPVEQATVPVLDRGFLFGDGVYEVVSVYSRRPFRLSQHLDRLQASLDAVRLPNPHTREEWSSLVARLIDAQPHDDQSVYLQVTRGADSARRHTFPTDVKPTVLLMAEPFPETTPVLGEKGIAAVSAVDNRWLRCDVKSTSLLANVLLRQLASDAGCMETILFRDRQLTEGAASNIFVVRHGVLLAPPKNNLMLAGITYDVVLELAAAHDLPCEVRVISEAEVRVADELWMTSSTREVVPVIELDGRTVGEGRPGPVGIRMQRWYQEFKARVMRHG